MFFGFFALFYCRIRKRSDFAMFLCNIQEQKRVLGITKGSQRTETKRRSVLCNRQEQKRVLNITKRYFRSAQKQKGVLFLQF